MIVSQFLNWVLGFALAPINLIINNQFPDIADMVTSVENMFDKIGDVIKFVISYSGFYNFIIEYWCVIFIAAVSITVLAYPLKLFLKWLRSIL